ncbi:hypothetical protein [Litchfieldia salsa]|uniref:Uncharacterized protein n=1 Tax=Litchfieldia salsa TaxID=930152 RepID=A0A1H0UXW2_9BACI|nr:hypothetical protein [Litchfieldia salsa]SDP70748.1 hypothetical protein SAMN05216565_105227 [Litchfieldia salsa]
MASYNNKEREDLPNEGREKALIDIERFIDDGLAGGTVNRYHGSTNIEEARDLPHEDPPNEG